MKRLLSTLAVTAFAVAVGASAPGALGSAAAATAPPSPPPVSKGMPTAPPIGALPNTAPSPATVQVPLSSKPSPAPSGGPDDGRKGLDGVWEVVVQRLTGEIVYQHLKLVQKGSVITGIFMDNQHNNKQYPVAGSIDAKTIHLVVTKDDGTTMTLSGTVDGTTDMVGLLLERGESVAFTAAYRPKYKFIDSISPVPGGLGGLGGGGGSSGPP